ncbi:hypothetical protein FE392_13010 [Xenorhabdus sp. 12]|uniref:Uncharacterized protein n=1 Tax=Xenorhabdus santafensis TaxID=2582833 RepID=A0ABU4SBU2_9GAMM|nr:hypothetical protein [Xenorhabdus sp. 12]MDX7988240.1 hypothetical protein [Xenorhabdus sp. 12]
MKKIICALFLLASFNVFAQSINDAVLQKSMKGWQPLSISDSGNIITLTMNEDQITKDIYQAVIKMGVCAPLWLAEKGTSYLKKTKEIKVLNRHSYSGYVFENPRSSCDELGKVADDRVSLTILSHTHVHSNIKQ